MRDNAARIKDLSIALEALSRINNEGSSDLYIQIETRLRFELDELNTENKRRLVESQSDDDIPF